MSQPTCSKCGSPLVCPECAGKPPRLTRAQLDEVQAFWNTSTRPEFARLRSITNSRKRAILCRLRDAGGGFGDYLDWLSELIDACNRTPFLRGENAQGWRATFDWLHHNEANPVKVLEGAYECNAAGMYAHRQQAQQTQSAPAGLQPDTHSENAPRTAASQAAYDALCRRNDAAQRDAAMAAAARRLQRTEVRP